MRRDNVGSQGDESLPVVILVFHFVGIQLCLRSEVVPAIGLVVTWERLIRFGSFDKGETINGLTCLARISGDFSERQSIERVFRHGRYNSCAAVPTRL